MFTIIAAIGKNGEIGLSGNLIWRFKEDMQYFKNTTTNHKVVMGRKTFESIPGKKLKDRQNIVVTKSKNLDVPNDVIIINDFDCYLRENYKSDEEIFIIGGSSIYSSSICYANKMIITHIDDECINADTFFPMIQITNYWKKESEKYFKSGDISYSRVIYSRKY